MAPDNSSAIAPPRSSSTTQSYKSTGSAIAGYIRSARQTEFFSSAPPLATVVLVLLLDCVNGKAFKKTGRLICWPSIAYLAKQSGRCEGHTKRAMRYLVRVGLVKILRRGVGTQTSKFQLIVPGESKFDGRGSVSGLNYSRSKKDAAKNIETQNVSPLSCLDVNSITELIQRAGAPASGAPARDDRARQRAPETLRGKCIELNQQQSSEPTHPPVAAAAAAVLKKNLGGGGEDLRMEAVRLLVERGVPEVDAWDILSDPLVRIADHLLASTITRIKAPKEFRISAGAWWRGALRNHHRYGVDQAVQKVQSDQDALRNRKAENQQKTYFDEEGERLIWPMSDADVAKAHEALIEHYRSKENSIAVQHLESMDVDHLKTNRTFLRSAGRNKALIIQKLLGGQS